MRIFITGFQRSGTTLLRHVINNHPNVNRIFHESSLLNKSENCKLNIQKKIKPINIDKDTWGEKLPWFSPSKVKRYKGSIIAYCKQWNSLFLPKAKIIQIVRNPYDVLNSNKKTFKISYRNTFRLMNYFPKIIPIIDDLPNCITIKFEKLVSDQFNTIKELYKFLNLDYSDDIINDVINYKYRKFNKINPDRAFSYNEDDLDVFKKFNFKNIINTLNKFNGPIYK